jgi:hypothetical protein
LLQLWLFSTWKLAIRCSKIVNTSTASSRSRRIFTSLAKYDTRLPMAISASSTCLSTSSYVSFEGLLLARVAACVSRRMPSVTFLDCSTISFCPSVSVVVAIACYMQTLIIYYCYFYSSTFVEVTKLGKIAAICCAHFPMVSGL